MTGVAGSRRAAVAPAQPQPAPAGPLLVRDARELMRARPGSLVIVEQGVRDIQLPPGLRLTGFVCHPGTVTRATGDCQLRIANFGGDVEFMGEAVIGRLDAHGDVLARKNLTITQGGVIETGDLTVLGRLDNRANLVVGGMMKLRWRPGGEGTVFCDRVRRIAK